MSEATNDVDSIVTHPVAHNENDVTEELGLDHLAFSHPTLQLGNAALGAYLRLYAWCYENATGGRVPGHVLDLVTTPGQLRVLFRAGLLHSVDGPAAAPKELVWQLGLIESVLPAGVPA